jgi:hypothetical protein
VKKASYGCDSTVICSAIHDRRGCPGACGARELVDRRGNVALDQDGGERVEWNRRYDERQALMERARRLVDEPLPTAPLSRAEAQVDELDRYVDRLRLEEQDRLARETDQAEPSTIDEHLRRGRDLRSLADEVGLPTGALRAHRDEHVAGLPRGRRSRPALRLG